MKFNVTVVVRTNIIALDDFSPVVVEQKPSLGEGEELSVADKNGSMTNLVIICSLAFALFVPNLRDVLTLAA